MLDDVHMHLKRDITCTHGKEFGAAKHPIGCTVGALRLEYAAGVDSGSNLSCQVLLNHDNLQSRVDNSCFSDPVCDLDIDLMQGQ